MNDYVKKLEIILCELESGEMDSDMVLKNLIPIVKEILIDSIVLRGQIEEIYPRLN